MTPMDDDTTTADAIAVATAALEGDLDSVANIAIEYSDHPATLAGMVANVFIYASACAGHDQHELREALQASALADARNACRRRGTWTDFFSPPARRGTS